MVTPPYAGGQPAFGTSGEPPPLSEDGQHLLAVDFAGFAGTENEEENKFEYGAIYEFSRTSSGWNTEPVEPPAPQYPRRLFVAASADLSRSLWGLITQSRSGEEVGAPDGNGYTLAVREAGPPAHFTLVGPVVSPEHEVLNGENGSVAAFAVVGASHDLSHIALDVRSEHKQLWPGDKTREGADSLYEYLGGSQEPALVGVSNVGPLEGGTHRNEGAKLISECGTSLGSSRQATTANAVSKSGSAVYFTALHEGCTTPTVDELYARFNGAYTVNVSEPAMTVEREKGCSGICREDENEEKGHTRSPAVFEGASEDGSKVFFRTAQPLLNGDKDTTNDLYQAEVGEAGVTRLTQVTKGEGPTPGSGANVVAVARISTDGSHVYFVAKGVLATNPNSAEGKEKPEEGAYNLYVCDTAAGSTRFIANLMTRPEVEARNSETEAEKKAKEEAIEEARAKVKAEAATIKEGKEKIEKQKTECAKAKTKTLKEECEAELAALEAEVELPRLEAKLKESESELAKHEAELPGEVAEKFAEEGLQKTGVGPKDQSRPFETTPSGRFLVFVSPRHLTGSEDTSTVAQVFEYDAQTEALVRVSIGQKSTAFPTGYGDNGNTTNIEDAPHIVRTPQYGGKSSPTDAASHLSLSEGGAVVFTGADALTPGAVTGRENVYEYRNGNVYLISAGDEAVPLSGNVSRLLGTSRTGGDVFFFTTNSLVPQDTDTQASWYDAREGGGFPAPALSAACTGDLCQGPASAPPAPPGAGSTGAAEGNLAAPGPVPPKALTRAQKLSAALRACKRQPKKRRHACEALARKRYGRVAKAGSRHGHKGKR